MRRAIAITCLSIVPLLAQVKDEPDSPREVWERVIAAKGGRARLEDVENVLSIQRSGRRVRSVFLHVFPFRYWEYSDARPTVFGISVRAGDQRGQWKDNTAGGSSGNKPIWHAHDSNLFRNLLGAQALLLLETRWHKPTFVKLEAGRIGKTDCHVLTVKFGAHVLTYYIDKRSYRVFRASVQSSEPLLFNADRWELLDYADVAGLQMPRRVSYSSILGFKGTAIFDYQFNVEYAPDLFERPVYVEVGPEGWKSGRQR